MKTKKVIVLFTVFAFFSTKLDAGDALGAYHIRAVAKVGSDVITTRDLLSYLISKKPVEILEKGNLSQILESEENEIVNQMALGTAIRIENELFRSIQVTQEEVKQAFEAWLSKLGQKRWEGLVSVHRISKEEIKRHLATDLLIELSQKDIIENQQEWKRQLLERYPVQFFSKTASQL